MSVRTILEINHDELAKLQDHGWAKRLFLALALTGPGPGSFWLDKLPPGVRVLAQRHHTDRITLEIE